MKDTELRRLLARTCAELLARDVKHSMIVPVFRSTSDIGKKLRKLTQRLWALPGLWGDERTGVEAPVYLSDTGEIVYLGFFNDRYEYTAYRTFDPSENQTTDILRYLMEFRESHGLES